MGAGPGNRARAGVAAALQGSETPREYQAQWIWGNVESPKPFQFVRFRKTIELASRPNGATAYITADTFYRLWINGQLVMHGPARSSRGKATVDPVDVGRVSQAGQEHAHDRGVPRSLPVRDAVAGAGSAVRTGGRLGGKREIVAATDATWEAAEITAWSRESLRFSYQRGWIEQYDGREVPREKWRPAVVLGKVGTPPWQKVELRDIPLPAPLVSVPPAAGRRRPTRRRGPRRSSPSNATTSTASRGPSGTDVASGSGDWKARTFATTPRRP